MPTGEDFFVPDGFPIDGLAAVGITGHLVREVVDARDVGVAEGPRVLAVVGPSVIVVAIVDERDLKSAPSRFDDVHGYVGPEDRQTSFRHDAGQQNGLADPDRTRSDVRLEPEV